MHKNYIDYIQIKESGLSERISDDDKKPFIKMNYILSKLREKDVQPALE